MKKVLIPALAALLAVGLALTGVPSVSAAVSRYESWLGASVSRTDLSGSEWQSTVQVSKGYSSVRYGLESADGASNKFVRLANFDGILGTTDTGVTVGLTAAQSGSFAITFDYRLAEGSEAYADSDAVLTVVMSNAKKVLTFADLAPSAHGDYAWKQASLTLAPTANTDKLEIVFHMQTDERIASTSRYFDLDNVCVKAGSTELTRNGTFEAGKVSTADEKVVDLDASKYTAAEKAGYMLPNSRVFSFIENTTYSFSTATAFGGGSQVAMVPRTASSGMYRGTTAGESDFYAIYDDGTDNTFLRIGNFNGTSGSNRFTTYFYNNETGEKETMPRVNRIYITFRYRLYLDGVSRAKIDPKDAVLNFSTRSSANNNSGYVYKSELIVNEPDDLTWHEHSTILECNVTTTDNMGVYFYGAQDEGSYLTQTFIDIDDLVFATPAGENWSYLGGTFEGMVPEGATGDPFNENVFFNTTLGAAGEKIRNTENDFAIKLEQNEVVSLKVNAPVSTNVWHATFDVAQSAGMLDLYYGGRNGQKLTVTVGQNFASADSLTQVAWKQNGSGWTASVFYARFAPENIFSFDIVNPTATAITVDNVFFGQVETVTATVGDYATFRQGVTQYEETYTEECDTFRPATQKAIRLALYKANQLTQYSSQARMNAALAELSALFVAENKLSDLTALNAAVATAEQIYVGSKRADYTKASWIKFEQALAAARFATNENTQTEIDQLAANLTAATSGLTTNRTENKFIFAIATGGGLIGLGGLGVVGALIIKKKKGGKRNEING